MKQAAYAAYWAGWQDKEAGIEGDASRGHEAALVHVRGMI